MFAEPTSMTPTSKSGFTGAIGQKRTKLVATIGPATESPEMISRLITAGMNVARFNTKHNEPAWHKKTIETVREVAAKMRVPVAILIDLQGPEIRVNIKQGQVEMKRFTNAVFTTQQFSTADSDIIIPPEVVRALSVGNHVILDDGACQFVIVEKNDDHIVAECVDDCVVKTRKTMNTPNVVIEMPSLLPTDEAYLDVLSAEHIDYVALSFVRSAEDILHLRQVLKQKNLPADIIAKIENRKAIENLASIIEVSDGVMVARGDLAVEVDFEEMTYWQKNMIRLSRTYAKPVITATQMLYSMVEKPTPTRAEISDISNAIYDGTDALMLSEETTIGKFPAKALEVQTKIAQFYETHITIPAADSRPTDVTLPLLKDTLTRLQDPEHAIKKLVVVTDEPSFLRRLSSLRLNTPIIAITTNIALAQKLALSYNVHPVFFSDVNVRDLSMNELLESLKQNQKLSLGERVLFLYNFSEAATSPASLPALQEVQS